MSSKWWQRSEISKRYRDVAYFPTQDLSAYERNTRRLPEVTAPYRHLAKNGNTHRESQTVRSDRWHAFWCGTHDPDFSANRRVPSYALEIYWFSQLLFHNRTISASLISGYFLFKKEQMFTFSYSIQSESHRKILSGKYISLHALAKLKTKDIRLTCTYVAYEIHFYWFTVANYINNA